MEAMADPAYICSDKLVIEYMNPAMVKWLGKEVTGENCYAGIYKRDAQCPWCPFELIKQFKNHNYTFLNPRDNRHYNISDSPVKNADGSVSKFTIFRDITETLNFER